MAHKPYKNRRKEESLYRKRRLNPLTRAASTSSLYLLTPILIILAVIISSSCSGGAETKSSQAEITELTVGINSTDYSITFDENNAETVTIPYVSTLPAEIAVKTAAISAKATGLAAGDTLKITSGKAEITVAAEDGSTTVYTLSIEVEAATPLTSLTYSASTIGAFEGKAISDITPTIVPQDAEVKYIVSPPLPADLELNPESGIINGTPTDAYAAEATYTVMATGTGGYTGTVSTDITITVGTLSTSIEVSTVSKANSAEDKRYHYVAFTVQADGTSSMGRHKFALSLKSNPAPMVQEMNDGDGVYRIVNPTEKKVLLSYTLGSEISNLMADADYLGKMVQHGDQIGGTAADVDGYLLSPGTEYSLYALKDGGSSVEKLHDFTTDTFDTASTFAGEGKHLDPAVFGGEYMIDLDDPVFVFPISFIIPSSGITIYETGAVGFGAHMLFTFSGGTFISASEALDSLVVALVPSQSIEGGKPQVSIGNTNIVTWYLLMPMNSVKVEKEFRLRNQGSGTNLVVISPTLDQ